MGDAGRATQSCRLLLQMPNQAEQELSNGLDLSHNWLFFFHVAQAL